MGTYIYSKEFGVLSFCSLKKEDDRTVSLIYIDCNNVSHTHYTGIRMIGFSEPGQADAILRLVAREIAEGKRLIDLDQLKKEALNSSGFYSYLQK